jgi:hypothetical protein
MTIHFSLAGAVILTFSVLTGTNAVAQQRVTPDLPAPKPEPAAPALVPLSVMPAATDVPTTVNPMPGGHWEADYTGGKANVIRRDNTDVYIMSKPDRPYVVTGRIVSESMAVTTDEITGTVVMTNVTISEMIDALLSQARHRQTFYSFPYDAMLTFDGQVGTFIRWKNKPTNAGTPSADTSSIQQP